MTPAAAQMLLPFGLHFLLICGLYVVLTVIRFRAVRGGQRHFRDFAAADGDTTGAKRFVRNIANQFELAAFAWWAALFLIVTRQVTLWDVGFAWLFLVGRVIHSVVQVSGDDVRLRGQVYMITFAAVLGLMAHVAWLAWLAL